MTCKKPGNCGCKKASSITLATVRSTRQNFEDQIRAFAVGHVGDEVLDIAWSEFTLDTDVSKDAKEYSTIFPSWFAYQFRLETESDDDDGDDDEETENDDDENSDDENDGDDEDDENSENTEDDLVDERPSWGLIYLAEREDSLTAFEREFLEAASVAYFSLFQVESRADQTITLRDLFLNQSFTAVATCDCSFAQEEQILYAHVAIVGDQPILLSVAPYTVSKECLAEVEVLAEAMRMYEGTITPSIIINWDLSVRECYYRMLQLADDPQNRSLIIPEEVSESEALQDPTLKGMLARALAVTYLENWMDEPEKSLNGRTPREAAHSPEGKKLLNAMVAQFEEGNRHPEEAALFEALDVDTVREILGLKK